MGMPMRTHLHPQQPTKPEKEKSGWYFRKNVGTWGLLNYILFFWIYGHIFFFDSYEKQAYGFIKNLW